MACEKLALCSCVCGSCTRASAPRVKDESQNVLYGPYSLRSITYRTSCPSPSATTDQIVAAASAAGFLSCWLMNDIRSSLIGTTNAFCEPFDFRHSLVRPRWMATSDGARAVIIGRSLCRLEVHKEQKMRNPKLPQNIKQLQGKVLRFACQGSPGLPEGPRKETAGPLCGDISNRKRSEVSGQAFLRTVLCDSEGVLQFLVLRLELPAGR